MRDREDFGFGSAGTSYHDGSGFKAAAPRGVPLTGRVAVDKVQLNMHSSRIAFEITTQLILVVFACTKLAVLSATHDCLHVSRTE